MNKITLRTIKSFIDKNKDTLYFKKDTYFDGMTDGISTVEDAQFVKINFIYDHNFEYTFGIPGAWFVKQSRDYFTSFENENYTGYEVSNCCGSFILAIQK